MTEFTDMRLLTHWYRHRSAETRRSHREDAYAQSQPQSTIPQPNDLLDHIDAAIAELPQDLRDPLIRHFFQQQSQTQIAADTGITKQAISQKITKGIKQVREALKARGITVPSAAGLTTLLHTETRAVMPAALTRELAALALAAKPTLTATTLTLASTTLVKTAAVVLLVTASAPLIYTGATATPTDDISTSVSQTITAPAELDAAENIPTQSSPSSLDPALPTQRTANEVDRQSLASLLDGLTLERQTTTAYPTVSGIVRFEDGTPFPASNVFLVDINKLDYPDLNQQRRVDASADEQGHFTVKNVFPAIYAVRVIEPGPSPYYKTNELIEEYDEVGRVTVQDANIEDFELTYIPESELTINGVVVDSKGQSISGARIAAEAFDSVQRRARTNDAGRFTLYNLPDQGPLRLHIIHEDFTQTMLDAVALPDDLEIVLLGLISIEGRVIDGATKLPLSDFEVSAMGWHADRFREDMFFGGKKARNKEGRYRIDNMPNGDFTVVARAKGYSTELIRSAATEYETAEIDITLWPKEPDSLEGVVLSLAGHPVEGARVYTESIPRDLRTGPKALAISDRNGFFRIEDLPRDTTRLAASHDDYSPGFSIAGDLGTITLPPKTSLEVSVTSDGMPVDQAYVNLRMLESASVGNSGGKRTNNKGIADIEDLRPGPAMISIHQNDRREFHQNIDLIAGDSNFTHIDLKPARASLEVTVIAEPGLDSNSSAILWFEGPTGLEKFSPLSVRKNTLIFPKLPTGMASLSIMLQLPYRKEIVYDIPLHADRLTTIDVPFNARDIITGTIQNLTENIQPNLMFFTGDLSLPEAEALMWGRYSWRPEVAGSTTADEYGYFESNPLYPGTYTVILLTINPNDPADRTTTKLGTVHLNPNQPTNLNFTYTP